MKRILAILLCLALLLIAAGCSSSEPVSNGLTEGELLYRKYQHIIDSLENEDYEGAIYSIVEMAPSPEPTPAPLPEELQIINDYPQLIGEWRSYGTGEIILSVREDGTLTFHGNEYRLNHANDDSKDLSSGTRITFNAEPDNSDEDGFYFELLKEARDNDYNYSENLLGLPEYTEYFIMYYDNNKDASAVRADASFRWETVEITIDNWQDYMTLDSYYKDDFNAFNEWVGIKHITELNLKDGLVIIKDSDELLTIALEYNYNYSIVLYDVDVHAHTATEISREVPRNNTYTAERTIRIYHPQNGWLDVLACDVMSQNNNGYYIYEANCTITRIMATLTLVHYDD